MTLKQVQAAGWLKDVSDNFADLAPIGTNVGLGILRVARFEFDTAAAVSGAPYSTIGRKAIVPKANTPESTSVKCTAAREITCTVATSILTAGKLTGYLYYVEGIASA